MSGNARSDRIRNKYICESLGEAPIGNKMRETQLTRFACVQQKSLTAWPKKE